MKNLIETPRFLLARRPPVASTLIIKGQAFCHTRKAAKEIERFFGDDWLDRLMDDEGKHINSENFGTPRENEY